MAIEAPAGRTLAEPDVRAAVEDLVGRLKSAPGVATVADPYQAKTVTERVAMAQMSYRVPATDVTEGDRAALRAAADPAQHAGFTVEFGGDAIQGVPGSQATEGVGVLIAALVLAITFGSIVAAGLPLLTALIGVGVGMAGVLTVSGFADLNSNTPVLALMLGLAVGSTTRCSSSPATGTNSPGGTTRNWPPGGRWAPRARRWCSPA